MVEPVDLPALPRVTGPLPGPHSAELLIRQDRREPNARVYPRHIPIVIDEAWGSFVRDLEGNVFIDFLTGAGVLSLGHNHPESVRVVTEQLGRFAHGLDLPTPAKDAFTEAQLSMLPPTMRGRTRVHFCGPTGVNAVDAAIRLCKTATGRSDVVSFQGGFRGTTHLGMAVTGLVASKRPIGNGVPGVDLMKDGRRGPVAQEPATQICGPETSIDSAAGGSIPSPTRDAAPDPGSTVGGCARPPAADRAGSRIAGFLAQLP
ncbi:aminotransferase class III-fold pyridoxal phosphate-dependent enzyme [Pseudonocardia hierapolitana]|nr:aminotransferase class III-fold pyridoxal phosphate-dependent enzyme [Pseudonocardia hierapolitana]